MIFKHFYKVEYRNGLCCAHERQIKQGDVIIVRYNDGKESLIKVSCSTILKDLEVSFLK